MSQQDPQTKTPTVASKPSSQGVAPTPAPSLPAYPGISLSDVLVVRNVADAQRAFAELREADMLGFDTESKPVFFKGQKSGGPHLIQLATAQHAYLFHVAAWSSMQQQELDEILQIVRTLLEAPPILKLGFGLGDDLRHLRNRFGIEVSNVVDLARLLRVSKQQEMGAKAAVAKYLGMTLQKSKNISTSNWASTTLSERQMQYAADDAQVALLVYRKWLALRAARPQ